MKFEQDPWPQRFVLHRVASHGLVVNLHCFFTFLFLRPHNHESVDSSKHITVTSKAKIDVALSAVWRNFGTDLSLENLKDSVQNSVDRG